MFFMIWLKFQTGEVPDVLIEKSQIQVGGGCCFLAMRIFFFPSVKKDRLEMS